MRKRIGNGFRESSARPGELVAGGSNLYPVEDWRAFYWTMDREGRLQEGRAVLRLPEGIGAVSPRVRIGQVGVIENVRRWGVALRGGILEDVGWDPTPLLSHDRSQFVSDDAEALHLITNVTHFDLPGFFLLASEEHPFLLFDPSGELKGSYTRWYTYAGALTYLVSDGKATISFGLVWQEDRDLYRRVMKALNEELAKKKSR
ncbi:MAG: hypothetical protein ACM3JD_13060 [Rudaea sp.]